MEIYNYDIVFQEVPDEVSLCIVVCGCQLHCDGCHSPHTWKHGKRFGIDDLTKLLKKYEGSITCLCFMGGEWNKTELITMLGLAHQFNLKTCLYTGEDIITKDITDNLDYLKTGRWINGLGGLNSPQTNQVFLDLNNMIKLNYKFIKE
jgi:anaerobic ribonucleoside-triphosphate reductase activating protein